MADSPMSGLRALHYLTQEVANDVITRAHADCSWFAVVDQLSTIPALEALNHNSQGVSTPLIKHTLVVNVGDFLEMATNDGFVSTTHRVVNITGGERHPVPYFISPSQGVMIETLLPVLRRIGRL